MLEANRGKHGCFSRHGDLGIKSDQMFAELVASVSESVIVEIMDTETVNEAWAALQKRFAAERVAHLVNISKRMRALEFKDGNLAAYLNTMRLFHKELKTAGGNMSDDELVTLLYVIIQARHLQTLVSILSQSSVILTIEEVVSKLLLEDTKFEKVRGTADNRNAILFAGDRAPTYKKYHKKDARKCFNCGKVGHLRAACRSKKVIANRAEEKSEYLLRASAIDESGVAEVSDPINDPWIVDKREICITSNDPILCMRADSEVDDQDDVILYIDSGCSRHRFVISRITSKFI